MPRKDESIDGMLPVRLGHSQDKNEYQGAAAIAKAFGVSRQTVLRWEKLGAPIVKIGGKYQCEHSELWEWLKANKKRLYQEEPESGVMAGGEERRTPKTTVIAVAPWPLNSLAEICQAFERSRNTVVEWHKAGAPIAVEGEDSKKRYLAEYNALMGWLASRKNAS